MRNPGFLCCLLAIVASAAWADEAPSDSSAHAGDGYSPLAQIDRNNLKRLRRAWEHRYGDFDHAGDARAAPPPVYYDGRLYFCGPGEQLMALDPVTGERLTQTDSLPEPPQPVCEQETAKALKADILRNDRRQPVLIHLADTGDVFVTDAATGEPVFPIEEQPVPDDASAGSEPAVSRRRSPGIEPVAPQTLSADELFGLTVLDRDWCVRQFEASRYDGPVTPPSEQGSIIYPAAADGFGPIPAAFHPDENLLVVRAEHLGAVARLYRPPDPASEREIDRGLHRAWPVNGTDWWVRTEPFDSPLGVPCVPPPWGSLTAIDMRTGQHRWRIPLGQAHELGMILPDASDWGAADGGPPLVTGGDVVFIATGRDASLRGHDIASGEALFKRSLPRPARTRPVTFMAGDRQFLVIATGTIEAGVLVAFAFPER